MGGAFQLLICQFPTISSPGGGGGGGGGGGVDIDRCITEF